MVSTVLVILIFSKTCVFVNAQIIKNHICDQFFDRKEISVNKTTFYGKFECFKELSRSSNRAFEDIEPPKLHCKTQSSLTFKINRKSKKLVYLEYDQTKDYMNSNFTGYIENDLITINNVSTNRDYFARLWAIDDDTGIIFRSKSTQVTSKNFNISEKVFGAKLAKIYVDSNKFATAKIVWNPGNGFSCYYRIVTHFPSQQSINTVMLDMTKEPKYEYLIKNLKIGNHSRKKYLVQIISTFGENEKIVNISVKVPTCLESFKNLVDCAPENPKNLIIEKHNCTVQGNLSICDIKLKWKTPQYFPDTYTSLLVMAKSTEEMWKYSLNNISGDSNSTEFKNVKIEDAAQVELHAFSKGGASFAVEVFDTRLIKDFSNNLNFNQYLIWFSVSGILGFFVSLVLMLIGFLGYFIFNRSKYLTGDYDKDKAFWSNAALKNYIVNQYYFSKYNITESQLDPKWEIEEKSLLLENIIGFGAFGVIQKGFCIIGPDKKTKVAVKMLKAKPTLEQIRQFYDEIELMKTVPQHPHVVHLIGVVTKNRQSNPLMITEYCAKGDLHTFLKKVWVALGNRDSNKNACDSKDTQFCKEFNNDFYEATVKIPEPEYILQSKDLLSFARQIAIGMEYLSSLKIIHRDLAARNILITQDNCIKISDFGLSKDVYTNNMYKKTTCGKLPFRWMALESLTHQVYTMESDVWSFGIVLWEIVTLGGYPYPSIESFDLIAHLKAGNRMERPINCSKEVYSIMLSCWNASPKQRPSFTDLRINFEKLLETEVEYVCLDEVQKINYYCNEK